MSAKSAPGMAGVVASVENQKISDTDASDFDVKFAADVTKLAERFTAIGVVKSRILSQIGDEHGPRRFVLSGGSDGNKKHYKVFWGWGFSFTTIDRKSFHAAAEALVKSDKRWSYRFVGPDEMRPEAECDESLILSFEPESGAPSSEIITVTSSK